MVPKLPIKFHQNALSDLAGVALIKKVLSSNYILTLWSPSATMILLHVHLHMRLNISLKFYNFLLRD